MATKKTITKETKTTVKKPIAVAVKTAKVAPKKAVKKETVAAVVAVPAKRKAGDVKVDVFTPKGEVQSTMELPKEYFAAKVTPSLMAQAVRIYLANQREVGAATKTRGEVEGSTRKIYRQKGTGKARHGGIRAPIFVGGGIVFGPRPHAFTMNMPQKMKKAALASALTNHLQDGLVKVVADVDSLPKKTREFAQMFSQLSCKGKTLFFLSKAEQGVAKAVRNLEGVAVKPVTNATTYDVMTHKNVVFTKNAIGELGSQAK